jgi:hypothetical protein
MLDVIRKVDETFREIPHQTAARGTTRYISRSGFTVEFLTPNTGSAEYEGKPAPMPALGGASATPLRFLDFLIFQPIRSVLLHKAGIPVLVPAPERYAIHKLIVATRRRLDEGGAAKSGKDLRQAAILIEAMTQLRHHGDLATAYIEAWERGPAWREAIKHSLSGLDDKFRSATVHSLSEGLQELAEEPAHYGL